MFENKLKYLQLLRLAEFFQEIDFDEQILNKLIENNFTMEII